MSMTYDQKSIAEVEAAGSLIEAAAGLAVVVLAIIGLARGDTRFIVSIATIVAGVALLAQGGAVAAEYSKLLSMITGGTLGAVELGGGMTIEMLAGGGAIVLGILGLAGFDSELLLPAAVIAIGASLIFTASGYQRLNALKAQAAGLSDVAARVAQGAVGGAIAAQVLAGIAAIVLGILAFTMPVHASVLTLIGLLVLGSAIAVSGTALTGRLLQFFSIKRA